VGIVQNRMQIMCVTEDDIDALKSKDWQWRQVGEQVGMVDEQAWKKSRMGMGDGVGGFRQNR
jgi:hypothetical protein